MKKYIVLSFILTSFLSYCQDPSKTDWAGMNRYALANKSLKPSDGRIVFMGNSITEFWKVFDSGFFANRPYINRGISGQTTGQMLLRFRQDVVALKPKVVVIMAGINDIAENNGPIALEDIFRNIVSMVKLAHANRIKVVLSSLLPANRFSWRPELKPADKVIQLNKMISDYSKKHHVVFVDYYSKMVDDKKGLDKKYADDGVHPTLTGYRFMEPMLEKAIAKALSQL